MHFSRSYCRRFTGAMLCLSLGGCDPDTGQGSDTAAPDSTGAAATTTGAPPPAIPTSGGTDPAQPTPVRICVFDGADLRVTTANIHFEAESVVAVDETGCVDVEGTPGERMVGRVDAPGFAPAVAALTVRSEAPLSVVVHLARLPPPISVPAEAPAAIAVDGVRVEIPAHAAIDLETGEPVTGDYQVTIVPLDPAADMSLMPGPLSGEAEDSAVRGLESYFMAEITLWQGGKRLALDPAKGATLSFPIAATHPRHAELAPGMKLPAWWLDLDRGRWVQDGEGTIVQGPGGLEWTAKVSHFTWWNADVQWTEKNCFRVEVWIKTDPMGQAVLLTDHSVPVTAEGVDFAGFDTAFTDNGVACLEIPLGKSANVYAGTIGAKLDGSPTLPIKGDAVKPSACDGQGDKCKEVALTLTKPLCQQDEWPECYTHPLGPDQHAGQGQCIFGHKLCVAKGFFEACDGAVAPDPVEICDNDEDDLCNGDDDESCGDMLCNGNEDYLGELCWDPWPEYHFQYGAPAKCARGKWKCDLNTMSSLCDQLVAPGGEQPNNLDDENCDGWPADQMRRTSLSDVKDQVVTSVAATATRVYVAGFHGASFKVGNFAVGHDGTGLDLFVAAFDAVNLTPVNAYRVSSKPEFANGDVIRVAVDENGDPFVAGYCDNTVNIGPPGIPCAAQAFIAALDPNANLKPGTLQTFGDSSLARLDMAASAGKMHIIAEYADPLDPPVLFGIPAPPAKIGEPDIFYLAVDPAAPMGVVPHFIGGSGVQSARVVAVRGNDVFLAGVITAPTIDGLSPKGVGGDGLVVRFPKAMPQTSTYTQIWGAGPVDLVDIAVDGNGRVFAAGSFAADIQKIGGDAPILAKNAGAPDVFVASFVPGMPGTASARAFPSTDTIAAGGLAAFGTGVVLGGHYSGEVAFDDHPMATALSSGFLVAFADPALTIAWSRELAGVTPNPNEPDGSVRKVLAAVGGNRLFTTAQYTLTVALDTTPALACAGDSDTALIGFVP